MQLEPISEFPSGKSKKRIAAWKRLTTQQLSIRGSGEIVAAGQNGGMVVAYLGIKALNERITNTIAQGDESMTTTLTEARKILQTQLYDAEHPEDNSSEL